MEQGERLRQQAAICRTVALGFSERRLVERMLAVAQEFEEEADAAETGSRGDAAGPPLTPELLRAMLGRRYPGGGVE